MSNDRNPYIPVRAKVLNTEEVTPTERLIRLRLEDGRSLGHQCGQFVEISLFGTGEAPLTIASPPDEGDTFEICVRAAGNLTRGLHRLRPGDALGVRGPYGRAFPLEELAGRDLLFIAGGIGMVPLRPMIKQVLQKRESFGRITVLYGTREPDERVFPEDLRDWEERNDVDYRHTLDRPRPGWKGHVGVVTSFLPDLDINAHNCTALAVGPPLMYKFVILGLSDKGMTDENIVLSFERHMKCGLGKCGHCQINGMLVCRQGPTFYYSELKGVWEAL